MQTRPIRILTFSSLFPNPEQPNHGVFVSERLRHLVSSGEIEASIVAPVPWFPSCHSAFGRYAIFARTPTESEWRGRRVLHPRFPVVPGPGWYATPALMARAVRSTITLLQKRGSDFDLIEAHYYYPDGIAATLIGRAIDKPVVITAHGSDINLICRYPIARQWVLWASRHSSATIAVSSDLRDRMIAVGIEPEKINVLRNGVDLEVFRPTDRDEARWRLGIRGRMVLSVGRLIDLKGHDLVIDAVSALPDWTLMIVGDGPLRGRLLNRAAAVGCSDRVRLVGAVPHETLVDYYNAADLFVLASSREGMACVLLEAAACGTPIIASRVDGSAEVLHDPEMGRLLPERSPAAIANAIRDLGSKPCNRERLRHHAWPLRWEPTTQGTIALFRSVLCAHDRSGD